MKSWCCGSTCIHFLSSYVGRRVTGEVLAWLGNFFMKHIAHSCGEAAIAKNSTLYTPPQWHHHCSLNRIHIHVWEAVVSELKFILWSLRWGGRLAVVWFLLCASLMSLSRYSVCEDASLLCCHDIGTRVHVHLLRILLPVFLFISEHVPAHR